MTCNKFDHNFNIRKADGYYCSVCGLNQNAMNPVKKFAPKPQPLPKNPARHARADVVNEMMKTFKDGKPFSYWNGRTSRPIKVPVQLLWEWLTQARKSQNPAFKFNYLFKIYRKKL